MPQIFTDNLLHVTFFFLNPLRLNPSLVCTWSCCSFRWDNYLNRDSLSSEINAGNSPENKRVITVVAWPEHKTRTAINLTSGQPGFFRGSVWIQRLLLHQIWSEGRWRGCKKYSATNVIRFDTLTIFSIQRGHILSIHQQTLKCESSCVFGQITSKPNSFHVFHLTQEELSA